MLFTNHRAECETRSAVLSRVRPVILDGLGPVSAVRTGLAAALAFILLPAAAGAQTGEPSAPFSEQPPPAEHATDSFAELPNFHRVSARLYRGAQPRSGGLARLAALGVTTVVNLREGGAVVRAEAEEARSLGLRFHSVETPGWGRPEDARIALVLDIIRDPGSGVVFVHCKDGVDRTGTIVALYRIGEEGWTAERALGEAHALGMRSFQVWMRDYVSDYASRRARGGAAASDEDFEDRLGDAARYGERGLRVGQRATTKALRRSLHATGRFFGVD